MLNVLRRDQGTLEAETVAPGWKPGEDVIWIDLLTPTREEELAVEAALGLELPTVQEMEALEPSSRLYQEAGATFMTATLLAHADDALPTTTPVTFVLAGGRLVTLRYETLRAFTIFSERAAAKDAVSGAVALLGLLEAIVERLARVLDGTGNRVESASVSIFQRPPAGNFRPMLTDLAQAQSITGLTRNSLVSLARLISYAGLAPEIAGDAASRAHLESLQRDAQSLSDHAGHQAAHIAFLLDAALGLINIEQNGIIKFFSVVAVVFMPPTLIASIYGMNFDVLPELHWAAGYYMALAAMLIAAILPVLWFKRRGWL
ncbi:magnesium transporter CorA family protein [uncultured Phenylobacterium sp.]|uniref:magnesium transporter CorA family protein n=1 Tax=uncultured Phenylobacterium sp. TaxID=349273 RepID=UPI0025EA389A|nr:magnesium transporter CorA family protein [uncultured Phenylobacterium sp.]